MRLSCNTFLFYIKHRKNCYGRKRKWSSDDVHVTPEGIPHTCFSCGEQVRRRSSETFCDELEKDGVHTSPVTGRLTNRLFPSSVTSQGEYLLFSTCLVKDRCSWLTYVDTLRCGPFGCLYSWFVTFCTSSKTTRKNKNDGFSYKTRKSPSICFRPNSPSFVLIRYVTNLDSSLSLSFETLKYVFH